MNEIRPQSEMPQINIASREIVTRYQIDACITVMATSGSLLGHYLRNSEESTSKYIPEAPEARIALENTLIAACERLDEVLKEDKRWGMEFQTEVEKNYQDAMKTQHSILEQQRDLVSKQQAAAEEITSPHFRYRPTLFRMKDGSWCAFLGDVNYMDLGVMGVGNSAQDAIEAFDDNFRGVTNPKVLAWLKQREQNLDTGEVDAPFPNEQNEQSKTVDGPGTENSSEALREWDYPESIGSAPGPERGFRNQPAPPFKHSEGSWLNRLRKIFRHRRP